MKKTRIIILILVAGLACLLIYVCIRKNKNQKSTKLTAKDYEQIRKEMLEANEKRKVDFVIQGTVTDERGNLLNGVKVEIEKTVSLWFDEKAETSETIVVNEQFDIKVRKHHYLRIYFKKEGYYDEHFLFNPYSDKYKSVTQNGELLVDNFIKKKKKIGKLAEMKNYRSSLKSFTSG